MLNKNANCYNIEKNFKVRSVSMLQFFEHFQLIIDNSNINNDKQIKQKKANFFSANFSALSKFSSSFLWDKPIWNQKLLLLAAKAQHTLVRSFTTLSCFLFFTNIFGINFLDPIKTMLLNSQLFRWPAVKKILHILCVWTLKILFANKRILT